jgi:Protein of unknown function (DUF3616)
MADQSIFASISLALILGLSTAIAQDGPPAVAPNGGPWDAGGGFTFERREKKTRRALSGIACPTNVSGERVCLAVFDEGTEARHLTIKGNGYAVDNQRVVLLEGDVELDAEAAATDGRFYHVTGSHSAKRKNCANNPASRHVIRIAVDQRTGRASREGAASTGRLWDIMKVLPDLKDHVGDNMCLGALPPGKRGVNIEGLAIKDGRLFFGFRGPAVGGTAKILSVDAKRLFDGGDAGPQLSTVTVGAGRGIRDLHPVSDGILVLAGPDDDAGNDSTDWLVARWESQDIGKASSRPRPLARLDLSKVQLRSCDDEIKPEAFAVVADTPGQPYRMVVFSDGMCDGGPLEFAIPR